MSDISLNGTSLKRYGVISSVDYGSVNAETSYVDVPGSQTGSLDMSEADGRIKFRNRTIKIVVGALAEKRYWKKLETDFMARFAGKRCTVRSDDYPGKYAVGRLESIMPTYDHRIRYLTVSINAEPWWYNDTETVVQQSVSGTQQITLRNAKKPVVPKIKGSAGMKVTLGKETVTLQGTGVETFLEICLEEGENPLTVTGTGTIKFAYTEAQL